MANPSCSQSNLLAPCFLTPGPITPKQQRALRVYFKLLELAAIGGTDYNGRLSLLLSDAATLTCGMGEPDRQAARVQLAYTNAVAAGGQVPSGIQNQIAAVLCLVEATPKQLDEAELMLDCKLGRHKAYPQ